MKKKAVKLLEEYLNSECSDFGLSYNYSWIEDCNHFEVEIKKEHCDMTAIVIFKYRESTDDLLIELCEDSFYKTEHWDWTVKYFWMLISPKLFQ